MAKAYYIPLRQIARCASGMRTGCGFAFHPLLLKGSSLVPLGKAAPHVERPRPLGHHALSKHRLCLAYRSV